MRGIDNLNVRAYKQHMGFIGSNQSYYAMLTQFKTLFDTLSDWDKMNSIIVVRGNIFRNQNASMYSCTPLRSNNNSFYYLGINFSTIGFERFEIKNDGSIVYTDQTNTTISGSWSADFYVM